MTQRTGTVQGMSLRGLGAHVVGAVAALIAATVVAWVLLHLLGATRPLGVYAPFYVAVAVAALIANAWTSAGVILAGGLASHALSGAPGALGATDVVWLLSAGALAALITAGQTKLSRLTAQVADLERTRDTMQTTLQEMGHRSKNGLAVIGAIVRQSARTAPTAGDLERSLISRLEALARAQDLVTKASGGATPFSEIVAPVLDPFGLDRFERGFDRGHDLGLAADQTSTAALLLHELATNAVKYGALSVASGRVDLKWRAEAGVLVVTWTETGGPAISEAAATGFGLRLLRSALEPYGGFAEMNFPASGFVCVLHIPCG